ncbi:hypothetical protein LNN31_16315 [Acetobacterium wieringae]|uniref:LXG domain-containing protein n=1 Tax=Acetobacterium wieringae TaxID=52694 RepID=A0ABY6HEM7_9FIRM|nr:hypothetical protein [Acetobacterium wieringae]UYO62334.1 hypothetical protein LNN31_16315 [Acetobacterium wieringae]VUZ23015.1 Uncharacterised protein [Acetobacterium wieringae]
MDKENTEYEYDFSDCLISEEEANAVLVIQREFLESYLTSKDEMEVKDWLPLELAKQLPESPQERISEMSKEIIDSLIVTENKNKALKQAVSNGRSKESWLATSLKESTSSMSAQESAKYLQQLDDAVKSANEAMYDTITTKAGQPNMIMNLDGFIAEQHHANSFNLKAQSTGSDLYAEALKPKPGEIYKKNSVDIVIKDSSGNIVSRYQAKYGADAEATIALIKKGDYRGQQLLVPEEQVEAVQKAFPDRKVSATIGEGAVKSKPLTKDEAKELQDKAQSKNWLDTDWNDYVAKDIAMGIGKQAGYACLQGAAVGAGMNIATKVWKGEPIEGEAVVETAIKSGADFGVKTVTAGALKVAVEKELIRVIPKGTPASTLTNIAFVAVENVKTAAKIATGELTVKEGLDEMQQTTISCVAGIAASAKGAAIGAAIGTVLGPVGTAVGGFVGGTLGYMAGSGISKAVVKGVQKIRDTAYDVVKAGVETVKSIGSTVLKGLTSLFSF